MWLQGCRDGWWRAHSERYGSYNKTDRTDGLHHLDLWVNYEASTEANDHHTLLRCHNKEIHLLLCTLSVCPHESRERRAERKSLDKGRRLKSVRSHRHRYEWMVLMLMADLFIYLIINNTDVIMTLLKDLPSSQFSDSDTMASRINLHLSPLCLLLHPPLPPSFSSIFCSSLHLPLHPSLSLHHSQALIYIPLFFSSALSFSLCHAQRRRRSLAEGRAEPDSSSPPLGPSRLILLTFELNPRGAEVTLILIVWISVFEFELMWMCLNDKFIHVFSLYIFKICQEIVSNKDWSKQTNEQDTKKDMQE